MERLESEAKALRKVLKSAEEMPGSSPMRLYDSEPEGLAESIEQCISALGELERKLGPVNERKTIRFWTQALKWAFNRKDVEEIVKALDRLKMILILALSIEQW